MTSAKLTLVAQLVKNLRTRVNPWLFHFNVWQNPLQIKIKKKKRICVQWGRLVFYSWIGKIPWRRERLPTPVKLYYTKALSDSASSLALDWIRLLWRPRILASYGSTTTFQDSLEKGMAYPLQYSGLENSMECIVTGS